MPGKHDIYILKEGNEYRVRPAVWSYDGQGNPTVKFRNLTTEKVLLVLPADVVDNVADCRHELEPKTHRTLSNWTLNLKKKDPNPPASEWMGETHHYLAIVFALTGMVSAVGESEPIIIIDPPA